jgi:hypothetical protein
LARRLGWPERFNGAWEAFIDFSRIVDPVPLFDRHRMVSVSRWNSAVINQRFLTYNFRPKTEWPTESVTGGESRAITSVPLDFARDRPPLMPDASLDDFQLPPKSVFDSGDAALPERLVHVDSSLVDSYDAAVRLVADQVRGPMRLRESHGPFSNPEGADLRGHPRTPAALGSG